jgi:hypothetical protein
MRKNVNQSLDIPETPFVQSIKYLVVDGVRHSKQDLVERMKHEQIHR